MNNIGKLGCSKSPVESGDFLIDSLLFDIKDTGQEISHRPEMSRIENQGAKGSCVGHAYGYVKEWQEFQELRTHLQLSRQWIYELARKKSGHAEGTTMKAGAEILRELGVPAERYWPYTEDKFNIGEPEKGAYDNALIYRVSKTVYLRIRNAAVLRMALLKFGPVAIGVRVKKNWYRQKNGHIPTATICEHKVLGGHAICITGHSPKNKEWEFINSWSKAWGDKGYGYITDTEMKKIFMDGFALVDLPNKSLMKVRDLSEKEWREVCRS